MAKKKKGNGEGSVYKTKNGFRGQIVVGYNDDGKPIRRSVTAKTAKEVNIGIANRLKTIRKRYKLSQKDLSTKSGVSFGSIKRFEQTGEISLLSLSKIAIALELEDELDKLFLDVPFMSIEEVINEQS